MECPQKLGGTALGLGRQAPLRAWEGPASYLGHWLLWPLTPGMPLHSDLCYGLELGTVARAHRACGSVSPSLHERGSACGRRWGVAAACHHRRILYCCCCRDTSKAGGRRGRTAVSVGTAYGQGSKQIRKVCPSFSHSFLSHNTSGGSC